jgi:uncharacterized protein YegL
MTTLNEFAFQSARPFPVILMLDVSGSMKTNGKIDVLNSSVSQMLATFAEEDNNQVDLQVAIVTFGAKEARFHQNLKPADQIVWQNMQAAGDTPLGLALKLVTDLIEDRSQIPSRAYAPTIVLVSDGIPTDEWKPQLERLLSSERASKATRIVLGIGDDADILMLAEFMHNPDAQVLRAHEARLIRNFFRCVTMSVTQRSRSTNPNQPHIPKQTDLESFEDF